MLLTDPGVITTADLKSVESEIERLAGTLGVDLDTKIEQARQEAKAELQSRLQSAVGDFAGLDPVLAWHTGSGGNATRLRSEQIVVTTSLRLWLVRLALKLFFEDAAFTRKGDKYETKAERHGADADRAFRRLQGEGIAYVRSPLPRPESPQVPSSAAGSLPARAYTIRIAWRDPGCKESHASEPVSVSLDASTLVTVSIASLTPPTGTRTNDGQTALTYGTAATWVVYAGTDPDSLTRQAEIAISETSWTEPDTGLTSSGAAPGSGQAPEGYLPIVNALWRG